MTVRVLTAATLLASAGCGLLIHGRTQTIDLAVSPPGAEVTILDPRGKVVSGPYAASGPVRIRRLSTGQKYLVIASRDGFCPQHWYAEAANTATVQVLMATGVATAVFLVGLPILGWAVVEDTVVGGELNPDRFEASLAEKPGCGE